jgi:DNA-binding Lrp family transcriptional regulator
MSNTDLADAVGLSPSPCLRRVKALEDAGVIKRYTCVVDPKAAGLPIHIFISVSLGSQERVNLEKFESKIKSFNEVIECYLMTGVADYMLRVVVPDLESFEKFLAEKLTRLKEISNIRSSIALKQVVYKTELPLDEEKFLSA